MEVTIRHDRLGTLSVSTDPLPLLRPPLPRAPCPAHSGRLAPSPGLSPGELQKAPGPTPPQPHQTCPFPPRPPPPHPAPGLGHPGPARLSPQVTCPFLSHLSYLHRLLPPQDSSPACLPPALHIISAKGPLAENTEGDIQVPWAHLPARGSSQVSRLHYVLGPRLPDSSLSLPPAQPLVPGTGGRTPHGAGNAPPGPGHPRRGPLGVPPVPRPG